MLQDSDEEKVSRIFMILFEKKVPKRSANDFEDSQVGRVVLWDRLLRIMAIVRD